VTVLAPPVGVLKPDGVPAVILAVPVATALKVVEALNSPPRTVTWPGAGIVPTAVGAEETGTVTVEPPRTCWVSTKPKEPFKRAAVTVIAVLFTPTGTEKLGTPIPPGPEITKPEGASVAVAMPLVKPLELAVS
jgi:hypothetical protein